MADQVVIERAWALESQLRKLETLGADAVRLPPARLRVVSMDRQAGVFRQPGARHLTWPPR